MSALCQRLERAVAGYIRHQVSAAAFSTPGTAVNKTESGLEVLAGDGSFPVYVLAGQNEEEVALPVILVSCSTAAPDNDCPGNADCTVDVSVRFTAHSDSETPVVGDLMEEVSGIVAAALRDDVLPDQVSSLEQGLTVFGLSSQASLSRSVKGQTQEHNYQFTAYCSPMTFIE